MSRQFVNIATSMYRPSDTVAGQHWYVKLFFLYCIQAVPFSVCFKVFFKALLNSLFLMGFFLQGMQGRRKLSTFPRSYNLYGRGGGAVSEV